MRVAVAEVAIRPDFTGFRADLLAGVKKAVASVTADIKVDADTRVAARQIKEVARNQRVKVDVDVDQKPLAKLGADLRNIRTIGGELGSSIKLGSAIIGVTGLAGAAVSLSSALGAAAGAGIALAPALLAAGQGFGVVKLATTGVGDALKASSKGAKEYGEALRALPAAARPFVEQLVSLKPKLNELRTIAAEGLFPALQNGLTKVAKVYFPIFKQAVGETSAALGDLVKRGADLVSSGPFSRNLQALIQNNTRIIHGGGVAALSLADAFVTVSAAAIPLTNHLVALAVQGAERLNKAIKDARATGGLAAFFREAQTAIDNVLRVLGNVGRSIGGIFKAALPSGQQLLAAIERITDKFAAWVNSRGGQEQLRKFFQNARDFALGLLSAIEKVAPTIGKVAAGVAVAAAEIGKFAAAHPNVLLVGLALAGIAKTLPGLLSAVRVLQEVRLLLATKAGTGLASSLVNVGAAGAAAGVVFGVLKYNIDELKNKGFEKGHFLDPASWALKQLGGALGITKDKTKAAGDQQAVLKGITAEATAAFNAFATGQGRANSAVWTTTGAVKAQKAALDNLKNATLGAYDADTNFRRAQLTLNEAQREVTRLQKEGKTKTDEYKAATLNLRDAQSGIVHAKDGFVAALKAQKDAIKDSKDVTSGQVQALIDMYKRLGIKPPKDLLDFLATLKGKVKELKDHSFVITATGVVNQPGGGGKGGVGQSGRAQNRNRGGTIPGVGSRDTVPAMLTPGEFVIRKRAVKAIGLDNLQRMNAMNRGGPVPEPQRFALGGIVMKQRGEGGAKFATDLRSFYDGVYTAVAKQGQAAMKAYVAQLEAAGGGGGTAGGAAGIKAFIKGTDRLPYIWGGVGPRGYDCSGLTGEVYNRIKGRPSYRRAFTTASNFKSLGFKPGSGGTYSIGVTPGHHMAGEYGGLRFEAESTKTGIKIGSAASSVGSFPVRFHLNRGGVVPGNLAELIARGKVDLGGDPAGIRLAVGRLPRRANRHERIGVFHQGGRVNRDQLALLQRGERVLSAAQERARVGRTPAMAGAWSINVDARGSSDPGAVEAAARRGAAAALSTYRQARVARPRR